MNSECTMADSHEVSTLPCKCNVVKATELRFYVSKDKDVLGVYCNECGIEFLQSPKYDGIPGMSHKDPVFNCYGAYFRVHTPIEVKINPAFQVQPFRTPIESVEVIRDFLKGGDHLAWHRNYVIWHHGIVTEVNDHHIEIVEFNTPAGSELKNKGSASVLMKVINLNNYQSQMMKDGRLFRLDYPDEVTKANPDELVVARAKSRVGDYHGMYKLFSNNCEFLATFCKTGLGKCWQTEWIKDKIKKHAVCAIGENMRVVITNLKTCIGGVSSLITSILPQIGLSSVPFAESVEAVVEYASNLSPAAANTIGVSLALIIEFIFCMKDIWYIYKAEWDGDMTAGDCGASVRQRVFEAVFQIIPSILLSLGLESLSAFFLGLFGVTGGPYVLVTLVAAIFGGLIGRSVGSMLGSLAGSKVSNMLTYESA